MNLQFSQSTFENVLACEDMSVGDTDSDPSQQISTLAGSDIESRSSSAFSDGTLSQHSNTREARAKSWCFTLNDYTDDDCATLRALVETRIASYCIYGHEVASTGMRHLQGYIMFFERKRFSQVKRLIRDQIHIEVTRRVKNAIEYCKKDGNFEEYGHHPNVGKRSDLEDFKESVKSGILCEKRLREMHSSVWAKYRCFCELYVKDHEKKRIVKPHDLHPWQAELKTILDDEPNDRSVIFVVDLNGNVGKSWFAHHYCSLFTDAQVMCPGKYADMALVLRNDIRVMFLDAPRSKQGEYIQYTFLENVKDGYVFSSKYLSAMKQLTPCHVVVMMNEHPDYTKLSRDRYHVIEL